MVILYVGIRNYGKLGDNEWTCFGDFKLTGPNGDVELPAITNFNKDGDWKQKNVDGSEKTCSRSWSTSSAATTAIASR